MEGHFFSERNQKPFGNHAQGLNYDPDFAPRARYIKNAYFGYNQHVMFAPKGLQETAIGNIPCAYSPLMVDQATVWCEQNCRGKWRSDAFPVVYSRTYRDWQILEGCPGQTFFAFDEEADYMWFRLLWE